MHAIGELVYELVVGAAIGLACGLLGALALRRIALPASGLYPLATFGLGMVAFAAAGSAHASGFLAAYLAAVVLANSGLPHRSATRSFAEGLGWLAQIGLFVLLGLLVDPSDLGADLVPAIVVGLVLLLVARPLSVLVSLAGFRVPVARAGLPVVGRPARRGADRAGDLPDRRGCPRQHPPAQHRVHPGGGVHPGAGAQPAPGRAPIGADSGGSHPRDPGRGRALDVLEAELLTMTVQPPSRLHNVTVLELRLPDPSVITLIIRDGHTFVPQPDTRIEAGDELLIVTTTKTRAAAERRLRAVSRRGKLAYWFDEYGETETERARDYSQESGLGSISAIRFQDIPAEHHLGRHACRLAGRRRHRRLRVRLDLRPLLSDLLRLRRARASRAGPR